MRVAWCVLALGAVLAGNAAADQASDRLFAQAVGTKPEFTLRAGDRIVGITRQDLDSGDAYHVAALRAAGASWKKEAERRLDEEDEAHHTVLDAFSAVTLGGSTYVYFSVDVKRQGVANDADGEIDFRLVDVQTLQPYTLAFWGKERGNGKVEGEFGTKELDQHPELLAFLKGKAAACPRIYRGEKDSMSWVDDWKKANGSLSDAALAKPFRPVTIRWQYYDQNPVEDQAKDTKEGPTFKVFSYFRSSLIGYDKARKQYFPIWVESCNYGCNKEIRSVNGAVLAFVFDEWDEDPPKVFNVDLKTGVVRMGAQ